MTPTTILTALLTLAAAQDNPGIAGAWELQHPTAPLRLVLGADGAGTLNGVPVRWSFESGALNLTVPQTGRSQRYQARVAEKTLTLSGGGMPEDVVLGRTAVEGPDKRLIGRWEGATGIRFEFREDGTVANGRGSFPYSTGGGMLFFSSNGTIYSAKYSIDQEKLVLIDGDRRIELAKSLAERATVAAPRPGAGRNVSVNGARLADDVVATLERATNVRILDGSYWYDRQCGAWGLDGGPTVGFIMAGLNLGGALKADASRGQTGVVINGRELPMQDVVALQQITPVYRGRYWLDAAGNVGYEGVPGAILNLVQLSNRAKGGGTYHSRNGITGIGSGGDGKTSYVMGKDFSVIIGE